MKVAIVELPYNSLLGLPVKLGVGVRYILRFWKKPDIK